ncbi:hypothetical protein A4X09_0g6417 [Tilletia walkeri]|uniref:Uncharacterized protein n=1 Tax=Tilletia walkeri TaxID=117179 RepID=A0A8X7N515_9BASI|nr:hypothetical protein A4X09_0g6417 [Tilletia walkeri]
MSSVEDLQSPPSSDLSSPDEIALSEISSLDGFELVEPEEPSAPAGSGPATTTAAISRRDNLRDRHEAVLLALRPELPPTVFHFPDPSAQSDDADEEGTGFDDNFGDADDGDRGGRLVQQQQAHHAAADDDDDEGCPSEAAASSTADCRSDSTRTTVYGLEKQPRWLARTSAWLATAGQGAAENEYAIPKLSLGTSFSQSCAEALHNSRLAAAAAAAAASSSGQHQDRSQFLSLRRRGKEFGQPTSIFVMLALVAAIFSLGLRLRTAPPSSSSSAAAGSSLDSSVPIESHALGMPVPVSLQVWHALEISDVLAPSQVGHLSASVGGNEEPYHRVQRVLEARRRRRAAAVARVETEAAVKMISSPSPTPSATESAITSASSELLHDEVPTTLPPKVEQIQSASSKDELGQQHSTTHDEGAPAKEPHSNIPLLGLDNASSNPLIDWNTVALFIRSLAAEARLLANFAHDLSMDVYRSLALYVDQAHDFACQAAQHVHATLKAGRDEVKPIFADIAQKSYKAASPYVQSAHDACSDAAQKSYNLAEPYVKSAKEAASKGARRTRAAARALQDETKPFVAQVEKKWKERNEARASRYRTRLRRQQTRRAAKRGQPNRAGFRTF